MSMDSFAGIIQIDQVQPSNLRTTSDVSCIFSCGHRKDNRGGQQLEELPMIPPHHMASLGKAVVEDKQLANRGTFAGVSSLEQYSPSRCHVPSLETVVASM